jgi:formylglycine-generating enzyme required for sulfatase activity
VGRFRQFVLANNGGSGWLPAAGSGKHSHLNLGQGLANSASAGAFESGWQTSDNGNIALTDTNLQCGSPAANDSTWVPVAGNQENLPINCVNWYEAYAFCIWDGGFLPSEAELGYATAGGSQQREYAWGSAAPGSSSQYAIYGCYYPSGSTGNCTVLDNSNIAPVGTASLGAGLWGQLDLAGDVRELTLDYYNSTYVDPCTDCAYLAGTATSPRAARGTNFLSAVSTLLAYRRFSIMDSTSRATGYGVRCARAP